MTIVVGSKWIWRVKGMVMILVLLNCLFSPSHQQYVGDSRTMTMRNNGKNIFIQRPFSSPPTIRAPPYYNSYKSCSVLNERENWEGNLCGDLNAGEIPINPLGHTDFEGDSNYPFELIKNKTLDFFRKALPVLKTYKSLPKVARYGQVEQHPPRTRTRVRRDTEKVSAEDTDEISSARGLGSLNRFGSRVKRTHSPKLQQYHRNTNNICENAIFCKLLNTMYDKLPQGFQRLVSQDTHKRLSNQLLHQLKSSVNVPSTSNTEQLVTAETSKTVIEERLPPQTPCPSAAEYLTPVFARNHEGAWRYVVQIPREGYFTQTVEVTKCIQSSCMYMDGNCRTSPRWQSLLVAELYYPDVAFPLPPVKSSEYNELKRHKRQIAHYRRRQPMKITYIYANTTTSTTESTTTTSTTETPIFGLRMKRRKRRNGSSSGKIVRNYDGGLVDSTENVTPVTPITPASNNNNTSKPCDGYDEIGCYQFRLFYDWFLIPGECKCWRKTFANFYQK